ncbi:hypothetical protein SEA_ROSE5_47 [Mycobacterium phage Rose5]|nr:hypothetical protein SEA_TYSON_47 [Mycobacterium phage Tyson]QWT30575.1 hypothetical protein SEA_ROSE5_47 [Mycobacterium phage Rose5]
MDRRLKRANDPLQYLTRAERREHARLIAKRQLSDEEQAYLERLDGWLKERSVPSLP